MLFQVTPKKKKSFLKDLLEWILVLSIAIVVSLFIISNVISITQIKEQSMEPNFVENDRVIVYKLGYNLGKPKRGDIIILNKTILEKGLIINMINEGKDILDNITYRFTGIIEKNNLIKRIVAIPGDTINIKDGLVYINGEVEQGYEFQGKTKYSSGITYPLEIPKDKYFVLGDNRENSIDSRNLGLIDYPQIKGKASFRIWPLKRFGKL